MGVRGIRTPPLWSAYTWILILFSLLHSLLLFAGYRR